MISALITHLQTNCPSFVTIEHAWTTEPLDELSAESPALFLYIGDKEASENGLDNAVRQRVNININFIVVGLIDSMDSLITELNAAMLGYTAGVNYDDAVYLSGSTLDIRSKHVFREEIYQTANYIRST